MTEFGEFLALLEQNPFASGLITVVFLAMFINLEVTKR